MLKVVNIDSYIDSTRILRNVSLSVDKGETVVLIGRNGAGKTSTIKSIMGMMNVKSGKIFFNGEDITNKPPYYIAKKGIGYCPEDRRIFPDLTTSENIQIGMQMLSEDERKKTIEDILTIFPELKKLMNRKGSQLSGGEQKMLSIARALAMKPSLLLLDEPLEGLAPVVVKRLSEAMQRIKELGVSMLIAESNISKAISIADKAYVIERGEIIYEGPPFKIYEDERVMKVLAGY